jgi:hypothetical protein
MRDELEGLDDHPLFTSDPPARVFTTSGQIAAYAVAPYGQKFLVLRERRRISYRSTSSSIGRQRRSNPWVAYPI